MIDPLRFLRRNFIIIVIVVIIIIKIIIVEAVHKLCNHGEGGRDQAKTLQYYIGGGGGV